MYLISKRGALSKPYIADPATLFAKPYYKKEILKQQDLGEWLCYC